MGIKELIIKGNPQQIQAYTKALIDVYGKNETLNNVITDLKQKRLNRQISYIKDNYGK